MRRVVLMAILATCWALPAWAQSGLDASGMTFKDFGVSDRGASFDRGDSSLSRGAEPAAARVLEIDNRDGLARVRFDSVKVEVAIPLGWQAVEDPERGIGYNADKSYRLIVWRLDFAFEGVRDAEHYAVTKSRAIPARHPTVRAQARRLGDGTFLVVYENVPASQGDSEPRTVFDLVIPNPGNAKTGVLMTLGVPASQGERGIRLLALLHQNIKVAW